MGTDRIIMASFAVLGATSLKLGPESRIPIVLWVLFFGLSVARFLKLTFELDPVKFDENGNVVPEQAESPPGKSGRRKGEPRGTGPKRPLGPVQKNLFAFGGIICTVAFFSGIYELALGIEGWSVSMIWCLCAGLLGLGCLAWLLVAGDKLAAETADSRMNAECITYMLFAFSTGLEAIFLLFVSAAMSDMGL